MKIHELIRDARLKLRMNQAQLGEMIGVSGGAVGNWERGGPIAEDHFEKLVELLKIDKSTIPPDELAHAIGRPSRVRTFGASDASEPIQSRLGRPTDSLFPPEVMQRRAERNRLAHGRPQSVDLVAEWTRANAPIKTNAAARLRSGIAGITEDYYRKITEHLPEDLRQNMDRSVSVGGFEYVFTYVSDKVILIIDTGFLVGGEQPQPRIFRGDRTSLWRLAVVRKALDPNGDRLRCCLLVPSFPFSDPGASNRYARANYEANVMGVQLVICGNDPETLAAAIELMEKGRSYTEEALSMEEDI